MNQRRWRRLQGPVTFAYCNTQGVRLIAVQPAGRNQCDERCQASPAVDNVNWTAFDNGGGPRDYALKDAKRLASQLWFPLPMGGGAYGIQTTARETPGRQRARSRQTFQANLRAAELRTNSNGVVLLLPRLQQIGAARTLATSTAMLVTTLVPAGYRPP